MKNVYSRLIVLLLISLTALLLVIGLRKFWGGYGLLDLLQGVKPAQVETVKPMATLADTPPVTPEEVPDAIQLSQEYEKICRAVMPSVVSIDTTGVERMRVADQFGRIFIRPRGTKGQGSGVIVSKEGHIITNHHVIANKERVVVTLQNGMRYEAKLIGVDPSIDIAVLKIDSPYPLKPLKFGDSSKVHEGNLVLAFGNPYGIGSSVTNGIISARKSSRSDQQISHFQSNVAINPGNSGGPLVNVRGEMIAVNSSIFSNDKDNPSFQGISFSIPSNIVKKTFLDILKFKRPMRGYLGIYAEDVSSPQIREKFHYSEPGGVIIYYVPKNSPAGRAGLKVYDIITKFDGKKVVNKQQLMEEIQHSKIGKLVNVTVWRDQKLRDFKVKIAQLNLGMDTRFSRKLSPESKALILKTIGISARNLPPDFGVAGVVVTHVLTNSLADGRLRRGDIIYKINDVAIYHVGHLMQVLLSYTLQGETRVYVIRNNRKLSQPIILPQVNQW